MVQHSPPAAESSWTEIEDLLDYLAQRASEPIPASDFFTELIDQAVPALAAIAGAVWTINPQGQLELTHQVDLHKTEIGTSDEAKQSHGQLLTQALGQSSAFSVPPGGRTEANTRNGQFQNPSDSLILFCPLRAETEVVGLLEIFQRPQTTLAAQQGFLRFLETLSEIAADFTRREELRDLRGKAALWGQYEAFAERVHANLDLDQTAFVLANEGRGLIGCDRASVVMLKGQRHCRVKAVSGQDSVDRRANTIRLLEQLCADVVQTNEPLWYAEDTSHLPPQIEAPLERYLDESHARTIAVVPLKEPADPEDPFGRVRTFGAFVAERFDADPQPEATRHRIESVCGHGAAAIHNSLEHQSLPFFKLLKALSGAAWYVRLKNLPKTLLVLGLIVGVVCSLIYIETDFTVSGEGELQPKIRRDVFAVSNGVIEKVHVQHGKPVTPTYELAEMRDLDLESEIRRVEAELQKAQVRLATVKALIRTAKQKDPDQYRQLSAEEVELPKLISSLERQLTPLNQKKAALKLKSPIAGEVLTWDVGTLLDNRPVSRGQILMTVADLSGPWVVEIRVPDDQIGHVLAAQEKLGPDEALPIEFLLATDPETTYTGKIAKISMTAESQKEESASVLVTVSINRADIPKNKLRPGATVIPKISCGKRAIGYVWFHGLIDAVKTYILF